MKTQAAELLQDLLPRQGRLLGAEHPDQLSSKNNLAGVLYGQIQ